jgi:uncharacterized protein (DUF1697 family)
MTQYVALLRGIGPMNPNMRNEKLRGVFAQLGFAKVATVISSGNVLFESPSTDMPALEAAIEQALPEQLGFTSTTIIRSREQLLRLAERQPFAEYEQSQRSYLTVTFLKHKPQGTLTLPRWPSDASYKLLGVYDGAICSVVDLTAAKTPDLMRRLEKEFGKEITTRTWQTVTRILKKME